MEYIEKLNARKSDLIKMLLSADSVDGEVKRVAGHFAVLALAGELAVEFGIVDWNINTPLNAAKQCFNSWVEQRGGTKSAEDTALIDKVKRILLQHGASRFQDLDSPSANCNNRLGFKARYESSPVRTEYYMLPETFKAEISNDKRAPKVLFDYGLLLKGDGRNYTRKTRTLPEIGNKRCYVLVLMDGSNYTAEATLVDDSPQDDEQLQI